MDSEKVTEIQETIEGEPAYRQVLRKTLALCVEAQSEEDILAYVASMPEMLYAVQEPGEMLDRLVRHGALAAQDGTYVATEEGVAALEAEAPAVIYQALIEAKPDVADIYEQVITFCTTKRTLEEITAELEADDRIANIYNFDNRVYPSFFLHNLRLAGVLMWDEGWITTEEGAQIIAA